MDRLPRGLAQCREGVRLGMELGSPGKPGQVTLIGRDEEAGERWTPFNSCTSLHTSFGCLRTSACNGVIAVESKASSRQKEKG